MTIEICICSRTGLVEPKGEITQLDVDLFLQDNGHVRGEILHKGTAYINRKGISNKDNIKIPVKTKLLMEELQALPPANRQALGQVNQAAGSDLTFALASFYENEISPLAAEAKEFTNQKVIPFAKDESNGILGAGLTAAGKRNTNFVTQITAYKNSLEALRNASVEKQPKAKLMLLQDQATRIHKTLNTTFNTELQRYMPKAGKRGSVWSSATRGAGLARGARTDAPINLTNTQEVTKLKNLGRGITIAGNGLLLLDAGFRVNKVLAEKEKGADWQRKMVKETAGFGLGGAAGIFVGEGAVGLASVFLASTPLGWVAIIGIGLSAGYLASKAGDAGGQFVAELAYDTSSNIRWFD